MKILNIIFSRTILVFLSFLAQFGMLFYFALRPSNYYYLADVLSLALSFIAILHMISKNQCPEFKLPWLLILISFPVVGLILYILFANRKLSKTQIAKIRKTKENMLSAQIPVRDKHDVKELLGDNYPIERYLVNVTGTDGHINNKVTYFTSGEDFFEDLKQSLSTAKDFIFMEYFIIAYGKMWNQIHAILREKIREGVEVRIMYDDIGSLGRVKTDFFKSLEKEGIRCVKFNPFRPILSGIHNNRDHRKITVIDGIIGYTGGLNIADEYINATHPHGHWKDTAIKICGSGVVNFTSMFLEMFDAAKGQVSDYKRYLHIECPKYEEAGFVHVFGDSPSPFDKEMVGESTFINLINSAKDYVFITTPYIVIDYALTSALRNAALRGIDVRIVTPHIPDKKIVFNVTRSHYKRLLEAGVKIYEYTPGFVHAKNVIVDDRLAFVGTINLDYRSLAHHFECGAILYDTPCIEDIKKDFDGIFKVSEEKTLQNFKMNKFVGVMNKMLAIFFPML